MGEIIAISVPLVILLLVIGLSINENYISKR